ncbi:Translation machinery-associated protein 64 [Nakaseomyces bracarensis]|uniref:Translation machinery-associated protein 64 n=1 Tax=Nakaseomyces bracarensis TaxID=273131 RepID=A0ABR4NWK2_9SACH
MFKKEPHIKALSNLKNSERKKLQERCRVQTGLEEYSFNSNTIKQTNFKGVTTLGTIYTNETNAPIWFKEKHDDTMYPTVITCWENRNLLPIVLTHTIVIEDHIYNGANLMISGTLPPFDEKLKIGTVCGIANRFDPDVVIAVGVVKMDLPSFSRVIGQTGVAVQVVHQYNDELLKLFKVHDEPPKTELEVDIETSDSELEADEIDEVEPSEADTDDHAHNEPVKEQTVDDIAVVLDSLSVEDIDYFITRALFYTISQDTSLETPISASNFVSNHINHNLPKGTNLTEVNIKKSSWKKTAKFLKHFEKEGFLKLKGKGDDLTIVSTNKSKDELKNFLPYPIIGTQSSTSSSTKEGSQKKTNGNNTPGIEIVSLYKPVNLGKELAMLAKLPSQPFYTEMEVKECVNNYIASKNMVDNKDKKMLVLDDLLMAMVYKKKEDQATKDRRVSRASILEPILKNNFNKNYHLYRKTQKNEHLALTKTPLKGDPPRVKIVTEMKIGRKVVTKISNFEVFKIDPEDFAADIRKKCSGSTTIGEVTAGGKKTAEVQVQGPHGPLIMEYLNSLGIPNKWIDFENKLKNKKKR